MNLWHSHSYIRSLMSRKTQTQRSVLPCDPHHMGHEVINKHPEACQSPPAQPRMCFWLFLNSQMHIPVQHFSLVTVYLVNGWLILRLSGSSFWVVVIGLFFFLDWKWMISNLFQFHKCEVESDPMFLDRQKPLIVIKISFLFSGTMGQR